MTDFRAFARSLLGLAALLVWVPSHSQSFPAKPVRIIVPLVAGGTLDTLSRTMAEKMSQGFGQAVYVENRPGASGDIGTVITVIADGSTLMRRGRFTALDHAAILKAGRKMAGMLVARAQWP